MIILLDEHTLCNCLGLPVWVLSLQTASILFVAGVVNAKVRLLARQSDRALLIAGHAARVEQASP